MTKCRHPKNQLRVTGRNPIVHHNNTNGGRRIGKPAIGSILRCLTCGHSYWSYRKDIDTIPNIDPNCWKK